MSLFVCFLFFVSRWSADTFFILGVFLECFSPAFVDLSKSYCLVIECPQLLKLFGMVVRLRFIYSQKNKWLKAISTYDSNILFLFYSIYSILCYVQGVRL